MRQIGRLGEPSLPQTYALEGPWDQDKGASDRAADEFHGDVFRDAFAESNTHTADLAE